MNSNGFSAKTGGINDLAGHYISACCRVGVFLESGELKPRCPQCGGATEWGMTLCRSKPLWRREARETRYLAPETFPHLPRVEWGGYGVSDVRVLNYSATGIAVEVPDPAIVFGEVKLTLQNGALVSGMIRHCRPRDTMYVLGIACEMDLRTLGLEPPDAKASLT
jgi:hypothetical protein